MRQLFSEQTNSLNNDSYNIKFFYIFFFYIKIRDTYEKSNSQRKSIYKSQIQIHKRLSVNKTFIRSKLRNKKLNIFCTHTKNKQNNKKLIFRELGLVNYLPKIIL